MCYNEIYMKNFKPSKIFTLFLLTLIVAVLGLVSKSEKRNSEQNRLSRGIIPSALADVPGGSSSGGASESLEAAPEAPEAPEASESCSAECSC